MIRKQLAVLVVVLCGTLAALVASAAPALADTACPAGTDTWYGPDGTASRATTGLWFTASNWSTGALPDGNCQALITVPGTYTVTIQPTCIGTDDCDQFGVNVSSLVLGAPTGSQTVDVSGQGSNNNGDCQSSTYLNAYAASTINPTGTLVLDSTAAGVTNCLGGAAQLAGAWTNDGVINVQDDDPSSFGTALGGQPGFQNFNGGGLGLALTNQAGGNVNLISGPVAFDVAGTGVVSNAGTITVDAAASVNIGGNSSNDGGYTDAFTNDGSIVDNGSITDGGTTWDQTGGSISGNAIAIGNNALLDDSGGTGQLQLTPSQTYVNGTIPAGQTVTVEPGVTLNDYVNNDLLVNDGTLVFDGNLPSAGQATALYGGSLTNNGALDFDATSPTDASELNSTNVTNTATGTIDLSGGTLTSTSNGTTSNSGTATVAPGAQWTLQGGSNISFANTATGTVVPEIASATSVGTFQVTGGCCSGNAVFTAGGTLAPKLVGGFTPSASEEFPVILAAGSGFTGTFSTIGAGFTGDYSQLNASSPFVGVIYNGTTTPTVDPTTTAISCSPTSVIVGSPSSCTATVKDTATSGAGTPTGTASFTAAPTNGSFGSSGGCTLSATSTSGTASCELTFTPSTAGSYTITGSYGADATHHTSSGTSSLTATTDPTSTAVSCSPSSVLVGSAATCTATVTDSASSGASAPTGTVAFTSTPTSGSFGTAGSCTLAAASTAGKASCSITFTPSGAGGYTITGSYGADTTHHTSSGAASLTSTTNGGAGKLGPGTITIGSAAKVASNGLAGVTLACKGATGDTCVGTLKLTVRVRTRVTRKVNGRRGTVTEVTTVTIGSAAYKLTAGQSETLGVKLSTVGARLLDAARNRRLAAKARATASAGSIVTKTVTLTEPPQRRKTER